MKFIRTCLFLVLSIGAMSVYGQRKSIPVQQIDNRFTLRVERYWGIAGEEYFYYVQNNTNEEYSLEVSVSLDLACHGTKSYLLGVNKMITLKPGAEFTPKTDWVHNYLHSKQYKSCRIADAESFTYFQDIRYTYANIQNLTQKKLAEANDKARKEALADKQHKDRIAKQQADAAAKAQADKNRTEQAQKSAQLQNATKPNTSSQNTAPQNNSKQTTSAGNTRPNYNQLEQVDRGFKRADGMYIVVDQNGKSTVVNPEQYRQLIAADNQLNQQKAAAAQKLQQEQQAKADAYRKQQEQQKAYNAEREQIISNGLNEFEKLGQSIAVYNQAEKERKQAVADARWERIRQENYAKGMELFSQYNVQAEKGNETAISKVLESYYLREDGISQREFADRMLNKFGSPSAGGMLKSYYNRQIKAFKDESNLNMRKGIGKLVLGWGISALCISSANKIDIYDEPDRQTEYDVLSYGGGFLAILSTVSSLSSFMKVGYKLKPDYVRAVQGLSQVDQKMKLSFSPTYNKKANGYGLAMRLTF